MFYWQQAHPLATMVTKTKTVSIIISDGQYTLLAVPSVDDIVINKTHLVSRPTKEVSTTTSHQVPQNMSQVV